MYYEEDVLSRYSSVMGMDGDEEETDPEFPGAIPEEEELDLGEEHSDDDILSPEEEEEESD